MFTVDTGVYILPYPLLLRFPMHCHKRRSCSTLHRYICPFSSETTTVRIGTKSFLHKPVPDVYQNYICTLIKPVFTSVDCVHVLHDVERKQVKEPHRNHLQRIPCSPAHRNEAQKILQRPSMCSEFLAHCFYTSKTIDSSTSPCRPSHRHSNSRSKTYPAFKNASTRICSKKAARSGP